MSLISCTVKVSGSTPSRLSQMFLALCSFQVSGSLVGIISPSFFYPYKETISFPSMESISNRGWVFLWTSLNLTGDATKCLAPERSMSFALTCAGREDAGPPDVLASGDVDRSAILLRSLDIYG